MGATKLMTAAGGGIILDAASTATDKTITIPAVDDTMLTRTTNVNSGTAVASTSGTSIDFTGIPSWVKRITVMFSGVSTNGSSEVLIQLGTAGGIQATGYLGAGVVVTSAVAASNYSTGFLNFTNAEGASSVRHGSVILTLEDASSGAWSCQGSLASSAAGRFYGMAGSKTLSGTLDRVRITTVNGTDTFDAGSINILYE